MEEKEGESRRKCSDICKWPKGWDGIKLEEVKRCEKETHHICHSPPPHSTEMTNPDTWGTHSLGHTHSCLLASHRAFRHRRCTPWLLTQASLVKKDWAGYDVGLLLGQHSSIRKGALRRQGKGHRARPCLSPACPMRFSFLPFPRLPVWSPDLLYPRSCW